MSNKEFLEVLNLYLDGEIAPEERERLESEIATNESRRAVFDEYVRLQEATEKLFNHYHNTLAESVDIKRHHVLARNSDQRYVLGFAHSAAAVLVACLSIFAATRILSDRSQVTAAGEGEGEDALASQVEVVGDMAEAGHDTSDWPATIAQELPPSSQLRNVFSGSPDLTPTYAPRGNGYREITAFSSRPDQMIYRGGSTFEAPPPAPVASFRFHR